MISYDKTISNIKEATAMLYHRQTGFTLILGLIIMFLLGFFQPLFAAEWGGHQGNSQGSSSQNHGWQNQSSGHGGHDTSNRGVSSSGHRGDEHSGGNQDRNWQQENYRGWDTRYNHNRYYPAHGHYVSSLPRDYHTAYYHRSPYYFSEGVWYRPYGAYFSVIAPPIGLVIPILPPYYTTLWVGGIPYYYANETYYTYYPSGGYIVTDPPKNEVSTAPPEADWLYSYPSKAQSEQQQADDRYACHRWALGQTGYDPTLPLGGVAESQTAQKRSDYQRALGACLEGRGYSVK
jgi:hypothetical protein